MIKLPQKNSIVVSFRVNFKLLQILKRLSKRHKMTRGEIIRAACVQLVNSKLEYSGYNNRKV